MVKIPLFPLPLVLFPGGRLELQVFEVRYLDMVKNCLRNNSGFGIVMIEDGDQVLRDSEQQLPSVSHYGTYCTIIDFDQADNGMLTITIEGQVKFVIADQYEEADRLMMAEVEFLDQELEEPLPERHEHLANLLDTLIQHEAVQGNSAGIDFAQAVEVGSRLTELLPCPNRYKQRLLEMKDPLARLGELEKLIARLQDAKQY